MSTIATSDDVKDTKPEDTQKIPRLTSVHLKYVRAVVLICGILVLFFTLRSTYKNNHPATVGTAKATSQAAPAPAKTPASATDPDEDPVGSAMNNILNPATPASSNIGKNVAQSARPKNLPLPKLKWGNPLRREFYPSKNAPRTPNENVRKLQAGLNIVLGKHIKEDGLFCAETFKAVLQFQHTMGGTPAREGGDWGVASNTALAHALEHGMPRHTAPHASTNHQPVPKQTTVKSPAAKTIK